MAEEAHSSRTKAVPCARCGALNGAGFDRCVRCGQALSTVARSVDRLGARLDPEALLASKLVIGLTVLVFAAQVYVALRGGSEEGLAALLRPAPIDTLRFGALHVLLVFAEPWRLVSAIFVHFGALHLLGNMFVLTWLGRIAEPAVGPARLLLTYVVTGVFGFVASMAYTMFFDPSGGGLTAGASGAVFGLMGLVLGMLYRQRNPQWKRFALQAVLLNVVFGFAVNQANVGVAINNIAHLGGLVAGILFGLVFARPVRVSSRNGKSDIGMNVAAGLGLLTCVASLVLAQLSPTWREIDSGRERSSRRGVETGQVDFQTKR
ncbi:rhomboid family intramembrane serine protease [Polyangium sp. y55x31]|uniref:rhomboid family intramembrane serine protease n=1 Tax=Polyangium sp. y55x31 TaxID=3042688 RepID=UPI00248304A3|nr:rhomboid family intramembrane serine protease [Polyangium sp. y55x31]MDI1475780.1 rhomboid family intramembrane serine protease [Polyangium sp. y55x31]